MKAQITMTAQTSALPAPEAAEAAHRPRRVVALLAAFLAALLMLGALPVPSAIAASAGFGLSVSNGGKSTISALDETVSLEAQISLPAGTSVAAGSQTKFTLDSSLKRANNGPLPTGATAQSWDEATNTLTITWGPLFPGSIYAASINAIPSPLATSESTFQATAVMTGVLSGVETIESESSAPIGATGSAFLDPDAARPQPSAGDWTLTGGGATVPVGISTGAALGLAPAAGKDTAFRNLQIATRWDQQVGTDGLLTGAWIAAGFPGMHPNYSMASTVLQDDASSRVIAYGSFTASSTATIHVSIIPPVGTAPGRYSAPVEILDDADASGTTKVVVARATFTVVVPEASSARVTVNSFVTPTTAAPGDIVQFGQRIVVPPVSADVKDFTVTVAVPDQASVRAFGGVIDNRAAKKVEYTTDGDLATAVWSTLPRDTSGVITLADTSGITGIRYTMNDFRQLRAGFGSMGLSAVVDAGTPVGTDLTFGVHSITYVDPVSGALTPAVDSAANTRIVEVVAAITTPPVLGAGDTSNIIGDLPNFGKVYANGNSFTQQLSVLGSGVKPVEKPYIFTVVPKGMSTNGLTRGAICEPYSGMFLYYAGCANGFPVAYPAVTADSGSIALPGGSTLYYTRATTGVLAQGKDGFQVFQTGTTFKLDALFEGEQHLLIGMGSATQDDFTVDSDRIRPDYAKVDLTSDASFGSFAGVGSDIRAALASIGVTSTSALLTEKSLTISPSTSLSSVTTIKGSEDSAAIVQGSGTATTRPGGTVNYQVELTNSGTATYKNFQFIDVLPRTGDTYTLNSASPRSSAFDVNLSGNVQVRVNGVQSAGATLEYTTSENPARFDATGADVAGDAWLPYTGAATGAKAIRVTLAPSAEFNPGDKITLTFDGTVPASAPRDGSLANNSIAYRFQTGTGSWIVAETTAVGVQSSAPAGDTELTGQAYLDLNGNGLQDSGETGVNGSGILLQLYKLVAGNPVAVPPSVTPNTDAGTDGVFSFIGLEANGIYKIKPSSTNPNVTFSASALDGDGFLKYTRVADSGANLPAITEQYVGSSEFKVGDEVGVQKWIKDLRLPVLTTTTIDGSVVLTDDTGSPVTVAGDYLAGFTVTLKKGATIVATTETDDQGGFVFDSLEGLVPGDYTLTFVLPDGRELEASDVNNPSVFTGGTGGAAGVYQLADLQPGTGAHDVTVSYTDLNSPQSAVTINGGTVVGGRPVNPVDATFTGVDRETEVVGFNWTIEASGTGVVASGTATAASATAAIPADLADGSYLMVVTATDAVGNVSPQSTAMFSIDKTAPVISTTTTRHTYVNGLTVPADATAWIALYGATAEDGTGVGVDGAITVDATAVETAAGSYPVVFTATDLVGNVSTYTVAYDVAYVGDPTVLLGTSSIQLEQGTTAPTEQELKDLFQQTAAAADPSATIASVTVDASAVNMAIAGSYPVVFRATDSLGAVSAAKTGTVVVKDTIAPTLGLAVTDATYRRGDTQVTTPAAWIALFQPTATDTGAGMPATGTLGITVDATAVNYAVSGTYPVRVTATDNAGNATTVTANYTVAYSGDPTIALGNSTVTHELGEAQPAANSAEWVALFAATGTAAAGGTVQTVTADASAVDLTTVGDYQVVFTVTDSNGNEAVSTGILRVEDTTAPVATLANTTGKHAMVAPASPWTSNDWTAFFGAAANDGAGTGVDQSSWTITHAVNWLVAGDYPVTFTVKDEADNTSAEVTATITIQAPPAAEAETLRIAQNAPVTFDPHGQVTTTGTLNDLTESDLSTPALGAAVVNGNRVTYTPDNGAAGVDTVEVTATDDLGQTVTVTYTITIVAAPSLESGVSFGYEVPVDGATTIEDAAHLAGILGENLTLTGVTVPAGFHGTVEQDGDNVVFTTDGTDWSGEQTFTFTVTDDLGQQLDVEVTITVVAPTFTVDLDKGYAGETSIRAEATGLIPGVEYQVELHSDPITLGTIVADEEGNGTLTALIPANATVGAHSILLINSAQAERGAAEFTVLERPQAPSAGAPGLASSGVEIAPLLWTGLGALLLGLPLLLLVRRRRNEEESAES